MTFWDRRVLHVLNCFVRSENSLLRGFHSSDRDRLKIPTKVKGEKIKFKKSMENEEFIHSVFGFICLLLLLF